MGGDIAVKSKKGFGTSMIVVFPSYTCREFPLFTHSPLGLPDAPDDSATMARLKVKLSGKKCLIIDDIPDNTFIVSRLLQNYGLSTACFNSSKAAFEAYCKHSAEFSLVITDLRLPEMSGQSLITQVRAYEKAHLKPSVGIIVLSGETSLSEKTACLTEYGANDFLLKPTTVRELVRTVEKVLDKTGKRTAGKKVLIVEDDAISRSIMATLIRSHGNQVIEAGTVSDALTKLERNSNKTDVAVILLDSYLPDGTGIDFMLKYKELLAVTTGPKSAAAVVSISGQSVGDQQAMYTDFDIHAFLQKPISKATLLNIVRSIK